MTNKALTEDELRNWVLSLPPDSIKSLEEALKSIRDNHFNGVECNTSNSSREGKHSLKDKSEVDDIDVSPPSRTNSPTSSNASLQSRNKFGKTYENGRRNLKGEEVSQEEATRRAKRRERNRLAAAKCRKRRQDKIETLQERVMKLKEDLDQLNSDIEINTSEQQKLDAIILSHKCSLQSNHNNVQNGAAVRPKSLKFENGNLDTQESSSSSSNVFICSLSPQLISLSPLLTPSTMKLVLDSINNHQFDSTPTSLLKDESSPQITIDSSNLLSSVTTPSQTFSRSLSLLNLMSPSSDLLNMNLFSSPSLKIAATIASTISSSTCTNQIISDHIKQEDE